MPGKLKIELTDLEKEKLLNLVHNPEVPKRTRARAEILILNARGWDVKKIKDWVELAPNTIRKTLSEWIVKGEKILWYKPRSGRRNRWQEEDIKYLEKKCEKEERTYNSKQLSRILLEERKIELSADRISRIL